MLKYIRDMVAIYAVIGACVVLAVGVVTGDRLCQLVFGLVVVAGVWFWANERFRSD